MDETSRPPNAPLPSERAAAWIEWFGPLRLVTSAVAVAVVCAGAWWLLRAPIPPTEASLPRTAPSSVVDDPASVSEASPPPVLTSVATTSTTDADTAVIRVHVAGAVHRPGVYDFAHGERVGDAIERAGGATATGRPHELNLALPLVDGMRVDIPVEGEAPDPALRADADAGGGALLEPPPIDVNVATVDELDQLPGVGPATAEAIVAERDRNGPFASIDDLVRVPGIGPAKLERLRSRAIA